MEVLGKFVLNGGYDYMDRCGGSLLVGYCPYCSSDVCGCDSGEVFLEEGEGERNSNSEEGGVSERGSSGGLLVGYCPYCSSDVCGCTSGEVFLGEREIPVLDERGSTISLLSATPLDPEEVDQSNNLNNCSTGGLTINLIIAFSVLMVILFIVFVVCAIMVHKGIIHIDGLDKAMLARRVAATLSVALTILLSGSCLWYIKGRVNRVNQVDNFDAR